MTLFTFTAAVGCDLDRGWPYQVTAGFIRLWRDEVTRPVTDGETATYRDQYRERVTVEYDHGEFIAGDPGGLRRACS